MNEPAQLPPDHGEFRMQMEGEENLIHGAIREANANVDGAPGQFWTRIKAQFEKDEKKHELIRLWGVDLISRTLVIRESLDGVEIACRSRSLTEEEIRTALDAGGETFE